MRVRSRILLSALFGAAALPSFAQAQEPQPWTNTSAFGDRVVPALPVRRDEQVVVRADGGTGSTGSFDLTEDRAVKGGGDPSKATFLAGRSGLSYGWEAFDVFITSYAYRVSIPKLARNPATGPLAVDPYTQTGDAALGARWTNARTGQALSFGVEGGAVFLGGTGDPGKTGVVFAGPNFDATSPFARGLLTWRGLESSSRDEPALIASLNLGVFADQSWNVWKKAVEDAGQDEATLDEPLEEERIAMSFYGEKGPVTRILFGASVAYQAAGAVRPFFELTGESTAPDLTMRVTPGVAIRPLRQTPLELFLSADIAVSDDHEVSPLGPAARVNAGFQFAFGERKSLPRATPARTSTPQATPTPRRNPPGGYVVSLKVADERGASLAGARVRIQVVGAPADAPSIGEGLTEANGTVTITTPAGTREGPNLIISARLQDHVEWLPVTWPPKSASPILTLYRQKTRVNVLFFEKGQPWMPPPGVDVQFTPTAPNARTGRTFSRGENIDLPANENFREWRITISIPDFPKPLIGTYPYFAPPAQNLPVYIDTEKKCAEFKEALCGPVVTATPTPAVAMDRFVFNVFDGDSVDVRADEAQKLLAKILPHAKPGHDNKVIVQARKGDPLFQQALAAARRDALLAWLHGKGVDVSNVRFFMNHEAASDLVILEVPK